MDLMPPPRDQTGADYSEMAAWTSVSGKTEEEVASLNLTTTYPAYKPVINYTKAVTKANSIQEFRSAEYGFTFGSSKESFTDQLPRGLKFQWALTEDDVSVLSTIGAEIRVHYPPLSEITQSYVFPSDRHVLDQSTDYALYPNADGVSSNLLIRVAIPDWV